MSTCGLIVRMQIDIDLNLKTRNKSELEFLVYFINTKKHEECVTKVLHHHAALGIDGIVTTTYVFVYEFISRVDNNMHR